MLKWLDKDEKINFTIKYISYLFIAITFIMIFLTITRKVSISNLILDLIINSSVIKLLTKRLSDVISIFINNKRKFINIAICFQLYKMKILNIKKLLSIQKGLVSSNINCKNEMKTKKYNKLVR